MTSGDRRSARGFPLYISPTHRHQVMDHPRKRLASALPGLRQVAAILLALILSLGVPLAAFPFSFSSDFDHSGFGSWYSVDRPTIGGMSVSPGRRLQNSTGTSEHDSSTPADEELMMKQFQEDLRAQQERDFENYRRLRKRIKDRQDIDEDREMDERKGDLIAQVKLELQSFEKENKEALGKHDDALQRLASSIGRINVPSPTTYESAYFMGTTMSPEDARVFKGLDPFSGSEFSKVFAFGHRGNSDFIRSTGDALIVELLGDLLSPETTRKIAAVDGVSIGRLVAHSNGATVAETLIRTGRIHVKKLCILNGAVTLLRLKELEKLAQEKNLDIEIYSIDGDAVSLISRGWKIRKLMRDIGDELVSFRDSKEPRDQILALTAPKNERSRVNVTILSAPDNWRGVARLHAFDSCANLIAGRRRMGCAFFRDPGCSLDNR